MTFLSFGHIIFYIALFHLENGPTTLPYVGEGEAVIQIDYAWYGAFPCVLPWMTDGNYPVRQAPSHNGNVINQLHLKGSIHLTRFDRGQLLDFHRSWFPFFFLSQISFFLLSMMGLHALSAHVLWWPPPTTYYYLKSIVIAGVQPPPTRRVARVVSKPSPKIPIDDEWKLICENCSPYKLMTIFLHHPLARPVNLLILL